MLGDLTGKSALITGGGQGVGRAIAIALAQQGANAALGDISNTKAAAVAAEVKTLGRQSLALQMDVTSVPSVESAVARVIAEWGHLDILVNNAGVVGAPGWIECNEDRYEDWDLVMAVNIRGVVNCCKAVMPHMIQRRYGKIISISSTAGRPGGGSVAEFSKTSEKILIPYSISKAAVIRYTQVLASALAEHNINVNGVAPGPMVTEMGLNITKRRQRGDPALEAMDTVEARRHQVTQATLFKRGLVPEDVGAMVAFLASDDTKNITGQVAPVDGGVRMV